MKDPTHHGKISCLALLLLGLLYSYKRKWCCTAAVEATTSHGACTLKASLLNNFQQLLLYYFGEQLELEDY